MDFREVCRRIREIKVQGAENVAFFALRGFASFASKVEVSNKKGFIDAMESAKSELFLTRPTEPMMRNFIRYVMEQVKSSKSESVPELKRVVKSADKVLEQAHKKDREKMVDFGAHIVNEGSKVFTHCHSSAVVAVFEKASDSKKFTVYNTETRPLFQGRKTALELSKLGIPVFHSVDSCAAVALSN